MPPQLGSDLGNLKRLVERSRQTRRWETTAFSTSGGGTLHVPRQKSRGIPTTGGGEGLSIGTPPIGEIIRVGIHSHLGNGNEPVLFTSIAHRSGFDEAVVPSSQIELPHGAIYGIEGELRWTDGFTGGGTVTLLLDDTVYMTLPGFSSAWTRFSIATEFDAVQGQRLSIFVDHDDTDADHDLQGELVIATKEPLKEVTEELLEPPMENLDVWWDADSRSLSAGTITFWQNEITTNPNWDLDDDGGNRVGGTVVEDALNGRPIVRLDDNLAGFLTVSGGGLGSHVSTYAVFRLRDSARSGDIWRDGSGGWHLRRISSGGGLLRWFTLPNLEDPNNQFAWRLSSLNEVGSANEWRNHGVVVDGNDPQTIPGPPSLSVGYSRSVSAGATASNLDLAEFLIYNTVHDAATRVEVEEYLAAKWGF